MGQGKEVKENHVDVNDNDISDKHQNGSQNAPSENGDVSDTNENLIWDSMEGDTFPGRNKKISQFKHAFQGGYFLIILSNGLSNVAFKFNSISFETQPTDVIQSLTVRITSFYVKYTESCNSFIKTIKM